MHCTGGGTWANVGDYLATISNEHSQDLFEKDKPETLGVRKALGLKAIGYDNIAISS